MDFKPIQQQKNYEQIVEQIKLMVSKGVLKPGDKLPAERVLADNLNVSRASVREALSALHLMGLIEVKSGEGTFIKQIDASSVIQPLALVLMMEKTAIFEILEVRKGLEVEAAGLAAVNANTEDIEYLQSIISEMKEEFQTSNLGEVTDWKFHCAVAVASHNSLLVRIMNTIADTMQKTLESSREQLFKNAGSQQVLFQQHNDIFIAIKNGDREDARHKMHEHLRYVKVEMKK